MADDRRRRDLGEVAFWGALSALIAAAVRARSIGLDPQTLWYDDLWAAGLTKIPFAESVTVPVASSPGFVGASWVAARLVSDPEVSLQLVPFAAALALIAAMALLTRCVTGSRAAGLLAASLVTLNGPVAHYAVFVKQYTLEALAVSLLLLFAVRLPGLPRRWTAAFVFCGGAVVVLGVGAAVTGVILTSVALALAAWRRGRGGSRGDLGALVGALVGFNVFAFWYYGWLSARATPSLVAGWGSHYMPTQSLEAAGAFLSGRGSAVLSGAMPAEARWLAWLALVGMGWMAWRARRREGYVVITPLAGAGLVIVACLVLSATSRYPIGGGRTDIFFFPFVWLAVAAGAVALVGPWRAARQARGLLAAAGVAAAIWAAPGQAYYELDLEEYARILGERARPSHGVVIYPRASSLAAYYSGWDVRYLTSNFGAAFFEVGHPRALTLSPHSAHRGQIQLGDYLLRQNAKRLWFLTTRERPDYPAEPLIATIENAGYQPRREWSSRIKTRLILFELAGSEADVQDLAGEPPR